MARVAATASLGMKVSLGNKKGYSQYDNASPHHSITIERDIEEGHPNDYLVKTADQLHQLARKLVETKINADLKDLKESS